MSYQSCRCHCHNTTGAVTFQSCQICNCQWNSTGDFDLTGPGPRVNVRSEIDYGPAILRALQDINEKLDKLVNSKK